MTTATTFDYDLNASVRAALAEAGVSITEVCRRTGISRTTLTRRLRGRGETFTVPELGVISHTLGISVVRLFQDAHALSSIGGAR